MNSWAKLSIFLLLLLVFFFSVFFRQSLFRQQSGIYRQITSSLWKKHFLHYSQFKRNKRRTYSTRKIIILIWRTRKMITSFLKMCGCIVQELYNVLCVRCLFIILTKMEEFRRWRRFVAPSIWSDFFLSNEICYHCLRDQVVKIQRVFFFSESEKKQFA